MIRRLAALLLVATAWSHSSASANYLYASRDDGTITRIGTTTGTESVFASTLAITGNTLRGLAFDSSGNLYAAYNGGIEKFTPGGVGSRRTPPLWLKPGDIVEVEIDRLGVLSNGVADET